MKENKFRVDNPREIFVMTSNYRHVLNFPAESTKRIHSMVVDIIWADLSVENAIKGLSNVEAFSLVYSLREQMLIFHARKYSNRVRFAPANEEQPENPIERCPSEVLEGGETLLRYLNGLESLEAYVELVKLLSEILRALSGHF